MTVLDYPSYPLPLLHSLLNFVIRNCLDNSSIASNTIESSEIIKSILLDNEESRDFINNLLRQCLASGGKGAFGWELVRGSGYVLKAWLVGNVSNT